MVAPPITKDQLERAFRAAEERRQDAEKTAREAMTEASEAAREMQAIAVLARQYGFGDFNKISPASPIMSTVRVPVVTVPPGPMPILDLIVAYFQSYPAPATPSEVADGITAMTGRLLSAAAVSTVKGRNAQLFESVEVPGKRGTFTLRGKENPKDPMGSAS